MEKSMRSFLFSMALKRFEKQILRTGVWKHSSAPNGVLEVTKDYLEKVVNNYKHTPFAPVYRGHADDRDAQENPNLIIAKNIVRLEAKDDGLYAQMEVPEEELSKYNDVSVSIDPDYENHETGEKIGPVLKHVAMVVNPYIKGLKPFVALKDHRDTDYVINLSDIMATKEIEDLKVEASEEEEQPTEATPESTEATPAEEPTKEPAPETPAEQPAEATPAEATPTGDVQASDEKKKLLALEEEVRKLRTEKAEIEAEKKYDVLLHEGKVTPASKNAFLSLQKSFYSKDINLGEGEVSLSEQFSEFLNKLPKIVDFTEIGKNLEEGDGSIQIPTVALSELRELHPEMNDEQFDDYVQKNAEIIKESYSKKKTNNI